MNLLPILMWTYSSCEVELIEERTRAVAGWSRGSESVARRRGKGSLACGGSGAGGVLDIHGPSVGSLAGRRPRRQVGRQPRWKVGRRSRLEVGDGGRGWRCGAAAVVEGGVAAAMGGGGGVSQDGAGAAGAR